MNRISWGPGGPTFLLRLAVVLLSCTDSTGPREDGSSTLTLTPASIELLTGDEATVAAEVVGSDGTP